MKKDKRVFIPIILISLIFLFFVAYSAYKTSLQPPGNHQSTPPNGIHNLNEQKGFDFTIFGNAAIVLGAISYWWLLFKKKLASPFKPLKLWGKRLYAIHTFTGWIALILVIIHGTYYLFTKFDDPKLLTGIAAFLILLTLAIYGWFYQRVKNKYIRTSHFILSHIWLIALFIHAGGLFFFMIVVTILLWATITWIDKRNKQATS
ncbi:hypothetical protein MK805_16970 [Shimazuella sp. AN120528]|uniref:hypothetical protein n=1 Tax=Shimazuella soli TaxID=1892854 RepID=UPI001F0FDFC3|nr:hypothetical protein [Shimazuella soli]MCH5586629.1 hypothetical protein [Shimazuella soli]